MKDWIQQDPEATINWARNALEGREQIAVFDDLLSGHSGHLSMQVQREMAEVLPGDSSGAQNFARRWAREDPQSAAAWAVAQGERASSLLWEVAENWAKSDVDGLEVGIEDEKLRSQVTFRVEEAREQQGGKQ